MTYFVPTGGLKLRTKIVKVICSLQYSTEISLLTSLQMVFNHILMQKLCQEKPILLQKLFSFQNSVCMGLEKFSWHLRFEFFTVIMFSAASGYNTMSRYKGTLNVSEEFVTSFIRIKLDGGGSLACFSEMLVEYLFFYFTL
jgi:hypothetical protein